MKVLFLLFISMVKCSDYQALQSMFLAPLSIHFFRQPFSNLITFADNMYDVAKSLHIIFMVSWFAGLFYMVRLFIYHVESENKPIEEKKILQAQFKIMQKRLWHIITWPAMLGTIIFGTWMLVINPTWLQQGYMHIKLSFVAVLIAYHFVCHQTFLNLQKDVVKWQSGQLRIWNEIATLLLVAIVFIIVMKNSMNWIYGVAGFFGVGILLMLGIKLYKKTRKDS